MESLLSGHAHAHHNAPHSAHESHHEQKPVHAPPHDAAVLLSPRRHREHVEENNTEEKALTPPHEVHNVAHKAVTTPPLDEDVPPAAVPLPRVHAPPVVSKIEFPLEPPRKEPAIESNAQPIVPARVSIPRKPIMVEGISASGLQVAYFCMEIGIDESLPTYAGGLGILAGDMLRSCADLELRTVGISLIHRKGYFRQRFDQSGWQTEEDVRWNPHEKLTLLPNKVLISIEGRSVWVAAWLYKVKGEKGNLNPIIFLDTDLSENAEEDRHITDHQIGRASCRERV